MADPAQHAALEERSVFQPMSFEEFVALPDRSDAAPAEWAHGVAELPVSPARLRHQEICLRLVRLLDAAFPGAAVYVETGVRMPHSFRVPDVVLVERYADDPWITAPPLLVAEVLSPRTRTKDMVQKSAEYAAFGIGQYWLVDPHLQRLTVLTHRDGVWETTVELDAASPSTEIDVPSVGVVAVDLSALLPGG